MGNILKGILYTGLAGAIGVGGYLVGKYKHLGGKISLTMVGLALVLYAPKGCDVAETYIKENAGVEKAKVYGLARKDSIDAIVNSEKLKDSTVYFKQLIQSTSSASKDIESTYKEIITNNENRYKSLLQKNSEQYDKVLNGVIEQNEALKKDLENLKVVTSKPSEGDLVQKNRDDNVNTVNTKTSHIEDKILPNKRKVVMIYQK